MAALGVDEAQERRIRSGLRLFRAVLAADEDIATKVDSGGSLQLAVVYVGDRNLALSFADELRQLSQGKKGAIRKLPVQVRVHSQAELAAAPSTPAGIYVVEALSDEALNSVVRFGIDRGIIVYSPYEGHVTRGVLGGLIIETRVRPYINLRTMRESKLRIKEFFLRVAKHYDP